MARYISLDPEKYIKIRDAAMDLFYEKGAAKTSMEEIARRAGIAKGTVYLYYASREVLEACVQEHCFALSLRFSMVGVDEQPTYCAKLKQRTRNILRFRAAHPKESSITQMYYKPVATVATEETPHRHSYQINRTFLCEGMASGEFKSMPIGLATSLFFSGVEGLCTYFTPAILSQADEWMVEQGLDALLNLLRPD